MAHDFPPEIRIECLREIIALIRKEGDLTRDDKLDIGQHAGYFYVCFLEWVRTNATEDSSLKEIATLIVRQILGVRLFGDLPCDEFDTMSREEICESIEQKCDMLEAQTGGYSAIPVIAIISLVVSLIKLLRDLDIIEPESGV